MYRLIQSADQEYAIARGRRDAHSFELIDNKRDEDTGQHLVLAQQLVERRTLRVAQRTEFARFVENGRIRRNRVILWVPEILADFQNECRHMVEKTLAWENIASSDRQDSQQALEPTRGQRAVLGPHACRDLIAKFSNVSVPQNVSEDARKLSVATTLGRVYGSHSLCKARPPVSSGSSLPPHSPFAPGTKRPVIDRCIAVKCASRLFATTVRMGWSHSGTPLLLRQRAFLQGGRTGHLSTAPLCDHVTQILPARDVLAPSETMTKGESTMSTLHDAFIDELRDTYDAEKQLTKALPKLAKAASNPQLREAFETHLEETQGHVERLEQVFTSLDEKARGKHCDGIAGIIEEGKSIMEEDFDDTTMDACLIGAGQRAEHYEMAAYGTLVAWAQAMGHAEAAKLLQQTLDEEKKADKKLSSLAEGGINRNAAASAHPEMVGAKKGRS